MPEITAKPLIQDGRMVLHPAPNDDVVHRSCSAIICSRSRYLSECRKYHHTQTDSHFLEVSSQINGQRFSLTVSRYQIRVSALWNRGNLLLIAA